MSIAPIIVKLYGLSSEVIKSLNLQFQDRLRQSIVTEIINTKELGLEVLEKNTIASVGHDYVNVIFNESKTILSPIETSSGCVGKIIIEVIGDFDRPNITSETRKRMVARIGNVVWCLFQNYKTQCFVISNDPLKVFWSSKP